jgi:PilZ domain
MAVPKQRRSSARKMRGHDAWITIDGDIRSYECQVADISAAGAKLVSDAGVPVGSLLKLSISPQAMVSKPCEVVWSRGRQIGVRFLK